MAEGHARRERRARHETAILAMLATRAAERPDPQLTAEGQRAQMQDARRALEALQAGLDEEPAADPALAQRIAAKTGQPVERVQAALDRGWKPPAALLE